jgi:hypothetical protein
MENLIFDDDYFQEPQSSHPPLKAKPGYLDVPSLYGRTYVIGVEFGQSAAGAFTPVCKIDAYNIESDADVDQLIQALQQTKALLKQLRHQNKPPKQK